MMLDEDEYWRLLSDDYYVCPYYRKYDEYKALVCKLTKRERADLVRGVNYNL